ncbi:M61 family metallopeptidase [bacterium]|nr:M61 family metallopeptidase [candidate division CSSED10-310 bacterium]
MEHTSMPVHYAIDIPDPDKPYLHITLTVRDCPAGGFDLKLPTWLPGAYRINDFSKNIEDLRVRTDSGRSCPVRKTDKQTWHVEPETGGTITVTYRLYAFLLQDDGNFVTGDFAVLNPSSALLAAVPHMKSPCTLEVILPPRWKRISTGLEPVVGRETVFAADDYHHLADSPLLVGNHEIHRFDIDGIPHEIAIEGRYRFDSETFLSDIEKIARVELEMMEHAPYGRYIFLVLITDRDAGLEHRNSTLIFCRHSDFRPRETYLEAITIFAHELFHAWNVKALVPDVYVEPDYFTESYSDLLWFSEGITNYYHYQFMRRAGVLTGQDYLKKLGKVIHRYSRVPGRHFQSASEASFDAWIKYYQHDENTNNSTVSYYLKGSLVAMLLDLELIGLTGGQRRLDDLMRILYRNRIRNGSRGFSYGDVKAAASEAAGKSMDEFFERFVEGTGDLPYDDYFKIVGLKVVPEKEPVEETGYPGGYLGAAAAEKDSRLLTQVILREGPAFTAGLKPEDELIAVDGYRMVKKTDLDGYLNTSVPGQTVRLTISRRGELRDVPVTLGEVPPKGYRLEAVENVDETARRQFEIWCGEAYDTVLKPEDAGKPQNVTA